MKHQNRLLILYATLILIVGLWTLPALVKKATDSNNRYPFMYYSSMLEKYCFVDYSNDQYPARDVDGREYNQLQADSLLPLLSYRQLLADGRMPDSLRGVEMSMMNLRSNSVVYRYKPSFIDAPATKLYVMMETMPLRVGLVMPEDFFRLDDKIEFINAATNSVDEQKSEKFQRELLKRGFEFPAQWAVGNPTTRKSYDEGVFALDNKNDLYHIKMVNGRPYVGNCNLPDSIEVAYFSIQEPSTRRFYGIIHTTAGEMYLLGDGYQLQKFDMPRVDYLQDEIYILGNIFYWSVSVTNSQGRVHYALCADSLELVDEYFIERVPSTWDKIKGYIFPVMLSFEADDNDYIYPRATLGNVWSLVISCVMALAVFVLSSRRKLTDRIFRTIFVAVGGVVALIVIKLLPKFR